jgi:hypothetical protein
LIIKNVEYELIRSDREKWGCAGDISNSVAKNLFPDSSNFRPKYVKALNCQLILEITGVKNPATDKRWVRG